MRINAISLSWFRGAADTVSLEPNCKSIVVYGANGSGKSSFVDSVEYALNDGKIRHLAHEYSGKRQEKAIPNTHVPGGRRAELSVKFADDSELKIEIQKDGSATRSGGKTAAAETWDYRRTVLRQDEVAAFIHDTKGGKYSALLPLLGLHRLEVAAENLRQLAKSIEEEAKITEKKIKSREVEARRIAIFGSDNDAQIVAKIDELHTTYCPDKVATSEPLLHCRELGIALEARIAESNAEQRRYIALNDAATLHLKDDIDRVRVASVKLAGAAESLIVEKLEVLQSTRSFVDELGDKDVVNCPACGRSIAVVAFQTHVNTERERLREIIEVFNARKTAMGALSDTVKALKTHLGKADVKLWRDQRTKGSFADNFAYLDRIDAEDLRTSCEEADLKAIGDKLEPLIEIAATDSKVAPPDAMQLSTDKQTVDIGGAVIEAQTQAGELARAEALCSFIISLERGVRKEIRLRAQRVIDAISKDIQAMWAILHPGEAIEDVQLYVSKDADKAIDIGLKFHGIAQESPRLTLSEGYRNSLGLCIFLAMAKREAVSDRPIFLDDVVISLDRNHRGMIIELLQKEFSERQLVILTHDREWYTELRQQLDGKSWSFKALLPYDTPTIGIRWSHKTTTFGDAHAHLKDRPDSAGNDARKIMDVELALIVERLRIRLPYLRAEKNDKRTAHEFLERVVADGRKCFQKRVGHDYEVHQEALEACAEADRLLVSWGNRASHTFDIVRPEATKLMAACEKALEIFKCLACGKNVWFADAEGSELVQCQCGQIRWQYGRG